MAGPSGDLREGSGREVASAGASVSPDQRHIRRRPADLPSRLRPAVRDRADVTRAVAHGPGRAGTYTWADGSWYRGRFQSDRRTDLHGDAWRAGARCVRSWQPLHTLAQFDRRCSCSRCKCCGADGGRRRPQLLIVLDSSSLWTHMAITVFVDCL